MLTLNNNSSIEYSSNNIPFSKVKSKIEKFNAFSTVKQLLDDAQVDDNVNIIANITLSGEIHEINTKFGVKKKRDVMINNDSSEHVMKLTLWNNHIQHYLSM